MEFNSEHPSWNYEPTATGNSSQLTLLLFYFCFESVKAVLWVLFWSHSYVWVCYGNGGLNG
jgi:hypothetical protein